MKTIHAIIYSLGLPPRCDGSDFAYATRRFYRNSAEGKPGTAPKAPEAKARKTRLPG